MPEDWKTKIPLAQSNEVYLSVQTMKSDMESFAKTGEAVPEVIMRKDIEAAMPRPYPIQNTLYRILLVILGAAIVFFLFSLYSFFKK